MRCANVVTEVSGATGVATGHGVTCVTTATGDAFCWGDGTSGELGNGHAWRDEPEDVVWE